MHKHICHFGWQLLVVHGRRNSKLHVCFDKVSDGPTYKKYLALYLYSLSTCGHTHTPQTKGGVGYVLKSAT